MTYDRTPPSPIDPLTPNLGPREPDPNAKHVVRTGPTRLDATAMRAACEHVATHGWSAELAGLAAGVSGRRINQRMLDDEEFHDAIMTARAVYLGVLAKEAHRRAVEGVETVKSITKEGEPIVVRVYSDPLLRTLLEAEGRKKYAKHVDIQKEVSGKVDVDVKVKNVDRLDLAGLDRSDRAALRSMLQRHRIRVTRGEAPQDETS